MDPAGTITVNCVGVAEITADCTVPNFTILDEIFVLKLEPLMVTAVPICPDAGLKDIIVGGKVTVKDAFEMAVNPLTVTAIGLLIAPTGTLTVNCVVVATVTVAGIVPNNTILSAGVLPKLFP